MKMSTEMYARFAGALTPHMPPTPTMQERWNCLHAHAGTELALEAYKAGLHDDHIDTALRKIAREKRG